LIFGYDLSLDPSTAEGAYLEKGEENGVHDAQIRNGPTTAVIVDVNKTDMGPPLALPVKEKLSAVKTLGLTLRDALERRS